MERPVFSPFYRSKDHCDSSTYVEWEGERYKKAYTIYNDYINPSQSNRSKTLIEHVLYSPFHFKMPDTKFKPGKWQSGGISSQGLSESSISQSVASQETQTEAQASQAPTHDTEGVNIFNSEQDVDTAGSIFGSSPRRGREGSAPN